MDCLHLFPIFSDTKIPHFPSSFCFPTDRGSRRKSNRKMPKAATTEVMKMEAATGEKGEAAGSLRSIVK